MSKIKQKKLLKKSLKFTDKIGRDCFAEVSRLNNPNFTKVTEVLRIGYKEGQDQEVKRWITLNYSRVKRLIKFLESIV